MSEATPGPWRANQNRVKTTNGLSIADTWEHQVSKREAHANARRIAAAPDMEKALERLTHNWDTVEPDSRPEGMTEALAALAKARGE